MAKNGNKAVGKIVFTDSPDYRLFPANGVWGGPTPRGEMQIDFIVDTVVTPKSVEHEILADGSVGPEKKRESEGHIERQRQVGLVLSLENAESIAKWILDKVRLARQQAAQKGETIQ